MVTENLVGGMFCGSMPGMVLYCDRMRGEEFEGCFADEEEMHHGDGEGVSVNGCEEASGF